MMKFKTQGNTAILVAYSGNDFCLSIPAEFEGKPITQIADKVFQRNSALRAVYLPLSIQHIGDRAFYGCCNLNFIGYGSSVEEEQNHISAIHASYIGNQAFAWTALHDIVFSSNALKIGAEALSFCKSLCNVVIASSEINLDEAAFRQSSIETAYFPTDDPIPCVPKSAFEDCIHLRNVNFRARVIRERAFFGCSRLRSIPLLEGLEHIEKSAFNGCTSLSELALPMSLRLIDPAAFSGSGILAFSVDEDNPCFSSDDGVLFDDSRTVIWAFPPARAGFYCVPEKTKAIRSSAFRNCALNAVTLPDSLRSIEIEEDAFSDCRMLTKLTMANLLKVDFEKSFYNTPLSEIHFQGTKAEYEQNASGELLNPECQVYFLDENGLEYSDFSFRRTLLFDYEEYQNYVVIRTIRDFFSERIDIPEEIDGKPVTHLGNSAIPASAINVRLPDSIESLESGSFANAGLLQQLCIPSHLYFDRTEIPSNCKIIVRDTPDCK